MLPACRPYLPPEWAPQSAVMLTWPHADSDWAPILKQVEPVFVEIAASIARFEKLLISCIDEAQRTQVAARLRSAGVLETAYKTMGRLRYCAKVNPACSILDLTDGAENSPMTWMTA